MPNPVDEAIIARKENSATIQAPRKPGNYRLYVWVKDNHGHAATANMPFDVTTPAAQ